MLAIFGFTVVVDRSRKYRSQITNPHMTQSTPHSQPLLPKQIDYCYSLRRRSYNVELTHNHDN